MYYSVRRYPSTIISSLCSQQQVDGEEHIHVVVSGRMRQHSENNKSTKAITHHPNSHALCG